MHVLEGDGCRAPLKAALFRTATLLLAWLTRFVIIRCYFKIYRLHINYMPRSNFLLAPYLA